MKAPLFALFNGSIEGIILLSVEDIEDEYGVEEMKMPHANRTAYC